MAQLSLLPQAKTPKDVVYTPAHVARDIVCYLRPTGKILDPCKGDGSFFDNFPPECESFYCEIEEGKDFYAFHEPVNWIIGNPPYSIFLDWLRHSFKIADNVAYLVPTNKIFQSWKVMNLIKQYGGIKQMYVYGSGHLLEFPFGFSVGVFHFQRGYKGQVFLQFRKPPNTRCNRPAFGGGETASKNQNINSACSVGLQKPAGG